MNLDHRKKKILKAVVSDYIKTGDPVGSRTIAKKYEMKLSPATIRNEMSDLEELGFLEQPHTSAGRIPSDRGYRTYVDELMETENITPQEENAIKSMLHIATVNEIDKIIKRTTRLLSEITQYTSAMLSPSVKKSTLKSIQLIQINSNDMVAIIITDTCLVKNIIIKLPRTIDSSTILKINNMLNEKLVGRTVENIDLSVISSIQREMNGYNEIFNAIIPALYECLKSTDQDVYLEGATNIFHYPEYNDVNKAKDFLSVVERKDMLIDLFSGDDSSIKITIGKENEFKEAKNFSVIKASYSIGGKEAGRIGIIGPKRMNYSKVIGILKFLTRTLNSTLSDSHDE